MTKIYGSARSRAARCLWAAEELGVKYEHVPIASAEAKSADNLNRNPNGHIPVLEDGGAVIWESMAINLYLAEKYGKNSLWPAEAAHGALFKWSFWVMTEVERHLVAILRHRVVGPPEQRDEKAAQAAVGALNAPLKVLDEVLEGKDYLLGKDFSIADLNVASLLSWAVLLRLDLSATPVTQSWLQKCLGREANLRARGMK